MSGTPSMSFSALESSSKRTCAICMSLACATICNRNAVSAAFTLMNSSRTGDGLPGLFPAGDGTWREWPGTLGIPSLNLGNLHWAFQSHSNPDPCRKDGSANPQYSNDHERVPWMCPSNGERKDSVAWWPNTNFPRNLGLPKVPCHRKDGRKHRRVSDCVEWHSSKDHPNFHRPKCWHQAKLHHSGWGHPVSQHLKQFDVKSYPWSGLAALLLKGTRELWTSEEFGHPNGDWPVARCQHTSERTRAFVDGPVPSRPKLCEVSPRHFAKVSRMGQLLELKRPVPWPWLVLRHLYIHQLDLKVRSASPHHLPPPLHHPWLKTRFPRI